MKDERLRARKYSALKYRVFFLELVMGIALLAFLQTSGVSGWLKSASVSLSDKNCLIVGLYATFVGMILYVAGLPTSFYKGYMLEHRFDLSNQALTGWLKDELKKGAISYIIFLIFVEFLYLLLRRFPYSWWIWMAAGWICFSIVFAKLVPVLIIPLFFKYKKLENKGLKTRLLNLAKRSGIKILDVFKLDLSAKTKKANAALAGMGSTRRILLGDTLLKDYTEPEIEVILAHELAHQKFAHIWRLLVFGGVFTVIGFYIIKVSLASIIDFLGLAAIYDIAALPSILLFLTVFSILIMPIQNWYSRGLERRADSFAIKLTRMPDQFISCMNKLARQNLANVSPSRFIEIMLYDHPPISRRIEMARRTMSGGEVRGGRK